MIKIEQANSKGRFTMAEIRQRVKDSRVFWSSPKGQQLERQREMEQRSKVRVPARFPALATRNGTRPAISATKAMIENHRRRIALLG